ncbi:MAG TPA: 2TM domain-containing protein [Polyangiaceae bacterium]|nr:2TM domain-containing protein [Polyangiaceae bacterium]
MSKDKNYADDEVRDIIERALKAQPSGGISHEDLLSIGAGAGLTRDAVESAARDVAEARLTKTATARIVSWRRRGVLAHAFVYAVVNGFLFLINYLTTPGSWWVLFPVLAWGVGLVLHAGFGLFSPVDEWSLTREKRRLLKTEGTGLPRVVRQAGVRIAESRDPLAPASESETEAEADAELESGSDADGSRGRRGVRDQ